ncbi:hypothetical protein BO70DRAFT_422552 [Aspergillus heteromorphus CBS 117.55]|uniref:Alkyl hydroperoxide reductase subunit C/ Thiol specific antioxidant domain-containing protein n=1 Tax=Aspergillus heteromorphus CBS 117.55 TaxID=1448321 RepID=A0A317WK16_9EURO|nr:uncharacterized protein BO70DRAFT_422552 [Aspergillus heteromorphus CBS 117.55]PWY86796.1 hypothetical protein BO70DRAFT_422552 [Aspergillus heteromorphus CBS 117.55]
MTDYRIASPLTPPPKLGAFAKLEPEFTARGVKLISPSTNSIKSHQAWTKNINRIHSSSLKLFIVSDLECKISYIYNTVDQQDTANIYIKNISRISYREILYPSKKIYLIIFYPASTSSYNTAEILYIMNAQPRRTSAMIPDEMC